MTATTARTRQADSRSADIAEHRARLRDLVAAEWIKLRSLRSTSVALAVIVLLYLFLAVKNGQAVNSEWPTMPPAMRASFEPVDVAFNGPSWLLLPIGAGAIGAMTILGEHASGLIRTTFIATPDRVRVIAAKITVVTGVMAVLGLVVAVVSFLASQAVLGHGRGVSITYPGLPRAFGASVLFVVACGLAGMAIGALIRNTAATIVAICVLFVALPLGMKQSTGRWTSDIVNAQPVYAWFPLTEPHHHSAHTVGTQASTTASWVALSLWVVISAIVALAVMRRRDV